MNDYANELNRKMERDRENKSLLDAINESNKKLDELIKLVKGIKK